ncbi:MAG: GNAT family N-acetyltransferase [Pirellulaceae bacterium]|nr:GNAT family N-acetyltransferase [Pirellulaceae bacterium]
MADLPPVEFALLSPHDYDAALALWNRCAGVRASETRAEFVRILERNPGLSPVARVAGALVGAVLCCHDGRRGYLYHLGVAAEFRQRGIARELVERSLASLAQQGIRRCTIFLVTDNAEGEAFWRRVGFRERIDLKVMARDLEVVD